MEILSYIIMSTTFVLEHFANQVYQEKYIGVIKLDYRNITSIVLKQTIWQIVELCCFIMSMIIVSKLGDSNFN